MGRYDRKHRGEIAVLSWAAPVAALILAAAAACAPGAPAATPAVVPSAVSSAAPAATPGEGPSVAPAPTGAPPPPNLAALSIEQRVAALLPAAAAYLEKPMQSPQATPAEAIQGSDLEALMRQYALEPVYLQRAQGAQEVWAGASSVQTTDGQQVMPFLLWRQGEQVSYRSMIGEDELFQYFINSPRGMRVVEAGGTLEMGLLTFNLGSTKDVWFMLLRLEDGDWSIAWSPRQAGGAYGIGGPSAVEYVGDGVDAFRVAGPLPGDVQAARVFDESGPFLKQMYESEWKRQGDRSYARVSGRLVPSALTSLASLLERLQQGDRTGAAAWATGTTVVDAALRLGLDRPAAGNGWKAEPHGQAVDNGQDILFYEGPSAPRFVATVVKQGDDWRVQTIHMVGGEG